MRPSATLNFPLSFNAFPLIFTPCFVSSHLSCCAWYKIWETCKWWPSDNNCDLVGMARDNLFIYVYYMVEERVVWVGMCIVFGALMYAVSLWSDICRSPYVGIIHPYDNYTVYLRKWLHLPIEVSSTEPRGKLSNVQPYSAVFLSFLVHLLWPRSTLRVILLIMYLKFKL